MNSDESSDSDDGKPDDKLTNLLVCGSEVMRPTDDDKEATRYKAKKTKTNNQNGVNYEPEKYEAALRNIIGVTLI